MPRLHVLRVFCAEDGSGGNPLGVFLDGGEIPPAERQAVAARLGFAETVFVDDPEAGVLRIFTPEVELPLAGHPLVGTAWLLRELGRDPAVLRPPAGECPVRFEAELAFVAGRTEWAPPFELEQAESPAEVEALAGSPEGRGWISVWAWLEEAAGAIRARVFAPAGGVPEDEATGSAAIRLCAELARPIQIRQGPTAGSLIYARPIAGAMIEIGGRVALDEVRERTSLN